MTNPIAILEGAGFQKVHNGGGTHVYVKRFPYGDIVASGFDCDLPEAGWYGLGLYRSWDAVEDTPLMFVGDGSAEYEEMAPRNFGHDLTLMIEMGGGLCSSDAL